MLSVVYAHLSLDRGELEGVEERLRDAERWLETTPDLPGEAMVVADDAALRRLPGEIAVARAGIALARGDVPASIFHAQRVLDLVPQDDHLSRGGAVAFLGLAAWTRGDLEAAYRLYADGMAHLRMAGNIADTVAGASTLAAIRIAQGRLHEAMRIYERGLKSATEQERPERTLDTWPVLRGAADMHVGMSQIEIERDDLQAAREHLLRSTELGEHLAFQQHPYRRRVAMARLLQAEGNLDGALDLLDEAERRYLSDFSPNVCPIAALRARIWLAQGRLGEALDWARARQLSVNDDLSYPREFEHLTLARLLLARAPHDHARRSLQEASGLLQRLLQAAEQGGRTGSIIEILVGQALAHQMHGDIPAALVPLGRALRLAEPEGYVRMFVDEGRPMAALLRESAARGIMLDYTRRLLAASEAEQPRSVGTSPLPTSATSQHPIEPLSERELDVLRLFTTELSGPEIANELMIAVSTLRTHTKSILSKLDVTNRRAAVNRAAELHLI